MGKKGRKGNKKELKAAAKARREQEKLQQRAASEWCEVRDSPIHGSGVYAAKSIPSGTRIIEYIGEKISKQESERRAWKQFDRAQDRGEAAVYIFTLSKKWDLDGSVEWNTARLINHSCEPNCEAFVEKKRIFIYALRDIERGEELSFDYGFGVENYEDHPCRCGTDSCVGYIVVQDEWPRLRELLAANESEPAPEGEQPAPEGEEEGTGSPAERDEDLVMAGSEGGG
ncbi:MAG: SET domain-containing protein-lysine N-methyltransferase [Akkermansiaceae bacterium]|nr:SET domain-containing protein-lysine N-methyltransferase [Akkermansiaceae bacterium]NNM30768.1 SET domain-containing protein-lysine N-methyltransferase [Akkermansiaceae bacterium]